MCVWIIFSFTHKKPGQGNVTPYVFKMKSIFILYICMLNALMGYKWIKGYGNGYATHFSCFFACTPSQDCECCVSFQQLTTVSKSFVRGELNTQKNSPTKLISLEHQIKSLIYNGWLNHFLLKKTKHLKILNTIDFR